MTMRARLAATCVAVASLAAACTSAEPTQGGTFTYALTDDPGALDPAMTLSANALAVFPFTYETLVSVAPDGSLEPQLATDWETTAKRAHFTIRDGATCADGSAVTASTVAENFEYIKDPENASPLVGVALPDTNFTVTADDAARTVTIELAEPFGLLAQSMPFFQIVCGEGLADREKLTSGTSGSGPFVLTEAAPGDHYTLERRDDYAWGPDGVPEGMPDDVVLRVVPNSSTIANMLLAGDLDGAPIEGPDRTRLTAAGLAETARPVGIFMTVFNQAPGRPGADPAVRRALAGVIDRAQLAQVIGSGSGVIAEGLTSGAAVCDEQGVASAVPTLDPDAAGAVLDEAGWTEGPDGVRVKDGDPLVLTAPFVAEDRSVADAAELIRTAWADLGVRIETSEQTAQVFNQMLFSGGDWDALPLMSLGVPLPSALVPLFSGPVPPDGINFAAINNGDFQSFAAQARNQTDADACASWNRAQRALIEQADAVPLVAGQSSIFAGENVQFEVSSNATIIPATIRR